MDAPLHFIRDGKWLDEIPFGATMGRARVIEIRDQESIKAEEMRPQGIRKAERILSRTHNSVRRWAADDLFDEDFVFISQEGARFLAGCGVQTVGVDYPPFGGFHEDGEETHQAPLGAVIWVIEGFDLSEIEPGKYELVCLPIKVRHSDGAPMGAILKRTR